MLATLFRPVTALSSSVVANATRRVNTAEGPLAQHIAIARRDGTDLTEAVFPEYVTLQRELIPHRRERLRSEWNLFLQGGAVSLATFGLKEAIFTLRYGVRLVMLFMAGVLLGRQSIHPLIAPSSPFVEALKYENPNFSYASREQL